MRYKERYLYRLCCLLKNYILFAFKDCKFIVYLVGMLHIPRGVLWQAQLGLAGFKYGVHHGLEDLGWKERHQSELVAIPGPVPQLHHGAGHDVSPRSTQGHWMGHQTKPLPRHRVRAGEGHQDCVEHQATPVLCNLPRL